MPLAVCLLARIEMPTENLTLVPGTREDALVERLLDRGPLPLLVVIGLSDTTLLEALERLSPATKVLAIEPDASTARSTRRWNDHISSGRVLALVGPDYAGSSEAFRFFPKGVLAPPVITAPGLARRIDAAAVTQAKTIASRVIGGVQANDEARRQFAGRYLMNTLRNLWYISGQGDAAALSGAFADVPALVVGAGPSLDRNIEQLQTLQHRALVVAVDTACRPLIAAGIQPHLVVSVDPTEINARHLAALPDTRGIWLVAEGSIDSSVFPQFGSRTFTFKVSNHHPWPFLAAHGADRGQLQAWGSVLTTAFDLAVRAGCTPIVFAGADLAYTDGLQYCRNTIHESKWKAFPTDAARAEHFKTYLESKPHSTELDVQGRQTVSTPPFVQFRDWIVAQSRAVNRQVINATGGGILHGGAIQIRDLAELAFAERPGHDADIQRRLGRSWDASTAGRDSSQAALQRALAYGSALPIAEWIEFGGDTAPPAQIVHGAQSAGHAMQLAGRMYSYLGRLRDFYEQRIATEADARALSHGGYDEAARQAIGQQAYLLLDVASRINRAEGTEVRGIMEQSAAAPRALSALDVGCGAGRSMAPLVDAGWHVDGVDISQKMIDAARGNPQLAGCQFFLSSGVDCGAAIDGAYDVVYSYLCFRHLTARIVRRQLLSAMVRALKPSGVLVVEMRFFPSQTAATIPTPHVPWSGNGFEAPAGADVRPTPDELHLVYADFAAVLRDVRMQMVDMPAEYSTKYVPHLIVSGSPKAGLWERMNKSAE
jgi:SAM-dependent methyltransferase